MSKKNIPDDTNQMSPELAILRMITSCQASQLIYVAAKLGIADSLKDGSKTPDQLARSIEVQPRALGSLGIFAENEDGRFRLTPLAEPLLTGAVGSMHDWAILWGEEWHWRPWGDILYSVRTGKPSFDNVFRMGLYEYFAANPEAGEVFDRA